MKRGNNSIIAVVAALCFLPVLAGAQELQSGARKLPEVSLAVPQAPTPLPKLPNEEVGATPLGNFPAAPPLPGVSSIQRSSIKQQNSKQGAVATMSIAKREVADDKDEDSSKTTPGMVMEAPIVVMPEATTTVHLSSSDLNRVICSDGEIKEALTSDEKGLMIKITGKDAFVKFKVGKRSDGKLSYSTTPTEIYMVCGGSTYSMIAFPSRRPSQTIKLSSGIENRMKENQALYAGLPFEKRVIRAIKEVYTDNIPESYSVHRMNQVDQSWKGLVIALRRSVDVEGEGMLVKEYHITLKDGRVEPFKLSEKMFLRKEFALNPVAISIDKHVLRPGDTSRLFVVEQRADKPLDVSGLALPQLEGGLTSIAPQQEKSSQMMTPFSGKGGAPKPNAKLPTAAPGVM